MIAERSRFARPRQAKQIVLRRLPAVVGRSPDAAVRLDRHDPDVALFHCTLERAGDRLVVRDLGSAGGTLLNGSCIRESVLLPDDELTIGRWKFRVCYDAIGHGPPPTVVLEALSV